MNSRDIVHLHMGIDIVLVLIDATALLITDDRGILWYWLLASCCVHVVLSSVAGISHEQQFHKQYVVAWIISAIVHLITGFIVIHDTSKLYHMVLINTVFAAIYCIAVIIILIVYVRYTLQGEVLRPLYMLNMEAVNNTQSSYFGVRQNVTECYYHKPQSIISAEMQITRAFNELVDYLDQNTPHANNQGIRDTCLLIYKLNTYKCCMQIYIIIARVEIDKRNVEITGLINSIINSSDKAVAASAKVVVECEARKSIRSVEKIKKAVDFTLKHVEEVAMLNQMLEQYHYHDDNIGEFIDAATNAGEIAISAFDRCK